MASDALTRSHIHALQVSQPAISPAMLPLSQTPQTAEEGDNPWVFLHFRFLLLPAPIFGLVQKLNQ